MEVHASTCAHMCVCVCVGTRQIITLFSTDFSDIASMFNMIWGARLSVVRDVWAFTLILFICLSTRRLFIVLVDIFGVRFVENQLQPKDARHFSDKNNENGETTMPLLIDSLGVRPFSFHFMVATTFLPLCLTSTNRCAVCVVLVYNVYSVQLVFFPFIFYWIDLAFLLFRNKLPLNHR